jgi:formylglycine-generating enzyme required for sulfatase activity
MRRIYVLVLLGSAGCFSSSIPDSIPDAEPDDAALDGASPEAATSDAPVVDATLSDAAAEASTPDASVADAGVPEVSVVDAPADAAPDVYEGGPASPCSSLDGGAAPSCCPGGPGMTSCGASSESCCASLAVPGGTYFRTYNTSHATSGPPDGGWTDEGDPATVSGFRLDKYDVTVGRFRQFVSAVLPADGGTGWLPPAGSGIHAHLNGGSGLVNSSATADAGAAYETGWSSAWSASVAPTDANLTYCGASADAGIDRFATWTVVAGSQENLPINCVTWAEAYAFCIWDGGFLPSEAEWEYAAAGGSEQREYPWGSADPGTGNQYAIYGCLYPIPFAPDGGTMACTGSVNIAPVGTTPSGAARWGHLDLAGEVFQWNADVFGAYGNPCTDCANLPTSGTSHNLRGGTFNSVDFLMLPPYRQDVASLTFRNENLGIRCARTP